jgi:endonuclease YncB( thermonuclease family)
VAVAVDGDTIVVGSAGEDSAATSITNGATVTEDNNAVMSGAAYVFKRTSNTWTQQAYLKAANAETKDSFGVAVAVDGDTIVVGAHWEDNDETTVTNGATASANNAQSNSGAAYVYLRTSNTWAPQAYLKAANAESFDLFGTTIAIDGDTIVVGSAGEDSAATSITNGATVTEDNNATMSGAAYVFKRTSNTWTQQAYLKAANAEANDGFLRQWPWMVTLSWWEHVVRIATKQLSQTGRLPVLTTQGQRPTLGLFTYI